MSAQGLDVHLASQEERLAAFANVFEVWPQAPRLQEHLRRRLRSPQHQRAWWFVGSWEGRVVTSLGAYPIQLAVSAQCVPAAAIGSVHTLSQYRGRGFASQLIKEVHRNLIQRGVKLALLYSDIDPRFYQRLGYETCPSWQGRWPLELAAAAPPGLQVHQSTWSEVAKTVQALYAQCHLRRPLAIWRTAEYWDYLAAKRPEDHWLLLRQGGQWVGYARVHASGSQEARVVDWALAPQWNGSPETLFAALAPWCRQHGWRWLGGWIPQGLKLPGLQKAPREREITMICRLTPDVTLKQTHIQAADWFLEVDHV